jgi:universal stress protein A
MNRTFLTAVNYVPVSRWHCAHMAPYRRILIAVDLGPHASGIARRGRDLAQVLEADVFLIHVIPPTELVAPIPPEPVAPIIVKTQADLVETAGETLQGLCRELEVPTEQSQVVVGEVRNEIIRGAQAHEAQLIVLGAHERHGLALLAHFSTEDKVLQRAPCDVLAVRVP